MSNLADFLLARIAEDEAAAGRAVEIRARYMPDRPVVIEYAWVEFMAPAEHPGNKSSMFFDGAPSPARVLAECDAKWRILAEHSDELDHGNGAITHTGLCPTCGEDVHRGVDEQFPCMTLRALALPYSDHPDFCEEWKL